jgi:hypothetical protein
MGYRRIISTPSETLGVQSYPFYDPILKTTNKTLTNQLFKLVFKWFHPSSREETQACSSRREISIPPLKGEKALCA